MKNKKEAAKGQKVEPKACFEDKEPNSSIDLREYRFIPRKQYAKKRRSKYFEKVFPGNG